MAEYFLENWKIIFKIFKNPNIFFHGNKVCKIFSFFLVLNNFHHPSNDSAATSKKPTALVLKIHCSRRHRGAEWQWRRLRLRDFECRAKSAFIERRDLAIEPLKSYDSLLCNGSIARSLRSIKVDFVWHSKSRNLIRRHCHSAPRCLHEFCSNFLRIFFKFGSITKCDYTPRICIILARIESWESQLSVRAGVSNDRLP